MGSGRRPMGPGGRGGATGVGGWNASLTYTQLRSRPIPGAGGFSNPRGDNQLLRGQLSFRPSEQWTVRWQTSYSFTEGAFSDHHMTLTRDLHRWQANFGFVKTQTGNFAFVFRVNLIDNPDLKFDYRQQNNQLTGQRF